MSEPHMTTEILESLHESLTLLYCIVQSQNEYNDEDVEQVERALNFVLDVIDYRKQ
jgi:thiamine monophosphate synthase